MTMTPTESRQIHELTTRLFGEDGEGGALGRIESKLDIQDGRIGALERDHIAREAVAAAGQRLDEKQVEKRRWQATTYIAMLGIGLGLAVQVLGALGVFPS